MSRSFVASLPYAFGGPCATGVIRTQPEDFFVDEIPAAEPSGEGEHCLLQIEKRGCNTEWVARQLVRYAGVRSMDVSYAGQKDRHAVTRQWFSVRLAGKSEPDWKQLDNDEFHLLQSARHNRKLKTGALRGNRFRIRVRDFCGDREALIERLQRIGEQGVPNYFGEQRFGHGDDNIRQAQALFAGELARVARHQRSHYLSAARSMLFNLVLAERVRQGSWNRLLPGERCLLDGSRSSFLADSVDETLVRRCSEMDIHPSAPLWGRGAQEVSAEVRSLEEGVLSEYGTWREGLERFGLDKERRSLRLRVDDLGWDLNGTVLVLCFSLPKGAFATVVLRELLDYREAGRP